MSDHDPLDRTYAQAEAMLDDEAARAARRARVLAAVTADAAAPRPAPPKRRPAWAAGGWLAAASVAGIATLVAVRTSVPPVDESVTAPPQGPAAAPVRPAAEPAAEAPPPAPATASAVERAAPRPAMAGPPPLVIPPADMVPAPPPPPPLALGVPKQNRVESPSAPLVVTGRPKVSAPSAPAPAPPASEGQVDALIVTAQKREEDIQDVPIAISAFTKEEQERSKTAGGQDLMTRTPTGPAAARPETPSALAARLRAAAARSDLERLSALLAQGAPVDAPDAEGETALMKAIQANRPAAARLLRGHGASLDRENRAGVSARDMAAAINDPNLNRALGLEP